MRGGPLSGYCQPVEIRAPQGARIAPVAGEGFGDAYAAPLAVGLAIGPVYRFRVTDIPEHPGVEVFPTVEMVDRLYPPPGQSLRFPVPVDLTLDELLMAAEGKFITRVIYVEDPQLALPVAEKTPSDTRWIDVAAGEDPFLTADGLGRPVAILRLGGRVPEQNQLDPSFVYGGPQPMVYGCPNSAATGGVMLTPHEEALPPAR